MKRLAPVFLLTILAATVLVPALSPHRPDKQDPGAALQPPSRSHWLGTDLLGRDLLSRLASGAQVSLAVGCAGTLVALAIGLVVGMTAGWKGGWIDALLMRVVDTLYGLPFVFVAILVTVAVRSIPADRNPLLIILGNESRAQLVLLFLVLGAVQWLTPARIIRAEVMALRSATYVEASRALGGSALTTLRRHILPNLAGPVLAFAALMVPTMMLEESFLSFIGLGARDPQASWGALLAEGAEGLNPVQFRWWLVLFPAAALSTTLVALQGFAEGLRRVKPGRSA
ncbi:MAG: oligopeptide transport system permease [Planctomycetota bacterium]|nr:MAG: oligopeptide transport system permease [Planctomycetota bacterium]